MEPNNRRQERLEEEKSVLDKKKSHCVLNREEFLSLEASVVFIINVYLEIDLIIHLSTFGL